MTEAECTTRKWGNSIGIIIPKEIVEKEHIKEDEKIVVDIKRRHYAREFFGMLSDWKRPTDEIKKEMKKGWE
ncbi:AbrB/MazE/SpoVT family DNA-binding domain-containing protein [Candidatus Woesearchaeota archaeon]|nr:AbrB/MazE/SpoVT family DNA-binding domain-containing protein [Candidatus Woesearchaeota archaeon]